MRLQSAIFDMDGTLLDSMHIWNDVGPKTLRSMGIEPAPDLGPRLMLMTFRDGAALCKEEYHLSESVEEIMDLTKDRVRSFYEQEVQAKPGVEKFLSLLKMEGVWMYVATNTDRDLVEAALKHTGLEGYFRGILTCAEVGVGKKDSPEIYERCMRRLRRSAPAPCCCRRCQNSRRACFPRGRKRWHQISCPARWAGVRSARHTAPRPLRVRSSSHG